MSEKLAITANGLHKLTRKVSGHTSIFYLSGNYDSATAILSYVDQDGTPTAYTDGTTVSGGQYKVQHGYGKDVYLNVTGASGSTNINVETHIID